MGLKKFIAMSLAFFTLFNGGLAGTGNPYKEEKHETYEHVIILGVDGAGNFHKDCDTPNMDKIFIEDGAWTDYCRAASPSISAQCWGSMLIGVKPSVHRLTNDIVVTQKYTNEAFPTIFKLVRNAHPDAKLEAICNWDPIYYGIIEPDINVKLQSGDDAQVAQKVITTITEDKPELLFVQFDSVDHAGHSVTYGSEKYLKTIEIIDKYVGKIYNAIEQAGILDSTLLIICADHGGNGTSHGGASEAEMNTFFGAHGKTINKTGNLELQGRDIAAIVCYALGVEGNKAWDSFIPQNLFTDNMNPPARVEDEFTEFETRPTPAAGTDDSIENFIDIAHLRAGLFFDDQLKDIVGKEKIEKIGTVYYPEGFYGSALRVSSEGYISFPDMKFGKDSFTICFWFKADEGIEGDPALFSNKDWESGQNNGLIFAYNGATKFNVGNGSVRDDFDYGEPYKLTGWTHFMIVVDREKGQVSTYANFKQIACDPLKSEFAGSAFDAEYPLNFGQDGTGKYEFSISAEYDDILIFDKALSVDEAANLKLYYNNK